MILYTQSQIEGALESLRIVPEEGLLTFREAALILGWKSEQEHQVVHTYPPDHILWLVTKRGLRCDRSRGRNQGRVRVADVFALTICPARANRKKPS